MAKFFIPYWRSGNNPNNLLEQKWVNGLILVISFVKFLNTYLVNCACKVSHKIRQFLRYSGITQDINCQLSAIKYSSFRGLISTIELKIVSFNSNQLSFNTIYKSDLFILGMSTTEDQLMHFLFKGLRRDQSGFDNGICIGKSRGQLLPPPSSKNYQYRTTSSIGQVGDATKATSDASSAPLPNKLLMSVTKIKPPARIPMLRHQCWYHQEICQLVLGYEA